MSAPSRPARPAARYRPGKAPVAAGAGDEYDSDESAPGVGPSDANAEADEQGRAESISTIGGPGRPATGARRSAAVVLNIPSGPSTVKRESPEYDSDEYETDTDDEVEPQQQQQKPVFTRPGTSTRAESESESEYETDSGSSEEEGSEEERPKPMFKPMFVSRKQREAAQNGGGGGDAATAAAAAAPSMEDLEAKAEAEAQKRRREAQQLASQRIKTELLEQQAQEAKPDLDDTDGLDPEGEFQAWRLRELSRIKRSLEAEIAKEQEEAERAKREAMSESDRLRLDTRAAEETRARKAEERKNAQNQPGYMQKYYHKGAFFQDLDILKKRDYSQATQDAVDVRSLPSVMQVRDFGKRGRSKWTHLANEDTSKSAISMRDQRGGSGSGSGCFQCGADDHLKRDCPQLAGAGQDEYHKRRRVDGNSFERSASAMTRDQGWEGRQQRHRDTAP